MVFWRKKNNQGDQEKEEKDNKLLHPKGEPDLELPTEYDADIDSDTKHTLEQTDTEILEDLRLSPVPRHIVSEDLREAEELSDHSEEGGWFSRLVSGLSKSSTKLTRGITDLLTKSRLDEAALERLEELLIEADLGPKTAAKIIAGFSAARFGDEVTEQDIRTALADSMAAILNPVARPLDIKRPAVGPFVILVCGVNGAGKTTTIGKLAYQMTAQQHRKVMIAAGDTFRAAAVEQLQEWAKRARCGFFAKDIGADAAAVAFESYQKAREEGAEVLLLDTAGRLQNKKNLMEELQKIIRVLKKQDENLPHAVLLVLDATTGQNAFSQVETFREMVAVTGLVVTKLDGSAKGGVLVGLADRFGVPVHAVGVGEGIEDLQTFAPDDYARALVGLS